MKKTTTIICALCVAAVPALANSTTVNTDFSSGVNGWSGPSGIGGATGIKTGGGNDGAYMHTVFYDFGVTFRNSTNADYLGDYTTSDLITLSVDVRVSNLSSIRGDQVFRPWVVELRDFDGAQGGLPYTSVWLQFDNISRANNSDWTTYSVSFDPNSTNLPAGWGGYGAEDPNTFEPILPDGVTFSDVLSGVDEIVFTTMQPGYVFTFASHTMGVDNLSITRTVVPAPASLALIGLSGLVCTRRRR